MNIHASRISLAAVAVLTAIGVGFLSACGPGAPLAPSESGLQQGQPLAKKATDVSEVLAAEPMIQEASVSAWVPITGRTIPLNLPNYAADGDVAVGMTVFTVPRNSMTDGEGHEITMTVQSGTTLEDVQVVFGPSGLEFAPPARLALTLLGPVTEEDVRRATHIYADGCIESIATQTDVRGTAFMLVTIRIPGFSRYSLGDGSFSPEADGAW